MGLGEGRQLAQEVSTEISGPPGWWEDLGRSWQPGAGLRGEVSQASGRASGEAKGPQMGPGEAWPGPSWGYS